MGRAHRKHRDHMKEEKWDGSILTGIMWHSTCTRSRILWRQTWTYRFHILQGTSSL